MNDPIQSRILDTETSIMGNFAKIVNGFPLSTIFAKGSIIHIGKGPEYASESFAAGVSAANIVYYPSSTETCTRTRFNPFQLSIAFLI